MNFVETTDFVLVNYRVSNSINRDTSNVLNLYNNCLELRNTSALSKLTMEVATSTAYTPSASVNLSLIKIFHLVLLVLLLLIFFPHSLFYCKLKLKRLK